MVGRIDVAVCACIVRDKKVLLVFHAKLKKWLFPGGHIEPGETPDKATIREIKEETGLNFSFADYGPIEATPDIIEREPVPFHVNLHSVGDHDHYNIYHLGTVDGTAVSRSKESDDVGWFNAAQLARLEGAPENIKKIALFVLAEGR